MNLCPATARRLAEIAARNRIREEAGLPLLSVPRELRRMKEAADAADFEAFAQARRTAVCNEVLAPRAGKERTAELATAEFFGGIEVSIAGRQNST